MADDEPVRRNVSKTARERAREEIEAEILRVGREHLAEVGAAALSLRAVARDLGMVSSAVYRYVANRDDLLTRLIDDAYNALGAAVEDDVASTRAADPSDRWLSAARAVRTWALERPHEYALIFGSPVPGYAAPESTTVSGTRTSLALISIVRDAADDRRLRVRRRQEPDIDPSLRDDLEVLRDAIDLEVRDDVVVDVLIAWSQLFGLVSFELFGQTRNVVTQHAELFDACARRQGAHIGLS